MAYIEWEQEGTINTHYWGCFEQENRIYRLKLGWNYVAASSALHAFLVALTAALHLELTEVYLRWVFIRSFTGHILW